MNDARAEDPSITLRRHMLRIATNWPALETLLGQHGNSDRSGVRRGPTSRPPIDAHVSDVIAEVTEWVVFLAHVLRDEVTVERNATVIPYALSIVAEPWSPTGVTTPELLVEIATWRTGHFTQHDDAMLAMSVLDDAKRLDKRVHHLVAPDGRRTIPLHIPCQEHGTSDMGERTVCPGEYKTLLIPGGTMQDMVCDDDPAHRLSPVEWQRSQRRGAFDPEAMRAMIRAVSVRHSSDSDERRAS